MDEKCELCRVPIVDKRNLLHFTHHQNDKWMSASELGVFCDRCFERVSRALSTLVDGLREAKHGEA